MHILLVGNGGREHSLAWKIAQSPLLEKLSTTSPGNPGIDAIAEAAALDGSDIAAWAATNRVDLVVVGPEAPLADGLADALAARSIPCFGPTKAAAMLETSKVFTRELCARHNIPAPAYGEFTNVDEAKAFVRTMTAPYVIKADGLAAGKGVVIAETLADADSAIETMLAGQFGAASETIIIEEHLSGTEMSLFALTDGQTVVPCGDAQDHKRAFDHDEGPNTGGMGGFSPSPLSSADLTSDVVERILQPTVDALREAGTPYRGVLYAGLFITPEGPKIIEYNCRFGDPECQMLMRRINGDIVPALLAAAKGELHGHAIELRDEKAANIVLATKGYPGSYEKGSVIGGVSAAEAGEDVIVFHAGTKTDGETLTANGGRVLSVTAVGPTYADALDRAYAAAAKVDWPQGFYRKDIGKSLRSAD